MGRFFAIALILAAGALGPSAQAQKERKPPYWASISASKAMMRTGPGRTFPATWLYVRPDLPIKVVEVYPDWRKIEDPDGATGWMLVRLLSDTRTAIVEGDGPQPMHEKADGSSRVVARAEPGVVGRLSRCGAGWCQFDARGRKGFIRMGSIWGVDPEERF
jgi:SH3-like domain-containing protein